MNCHPSFPARRRAFSIIEVIVVVGLMTFIIFGLVLMFTQTQRAYKLGTTQVDVLEGGRAVIDLMQRDLLQVAPAGVGGVTNFHTKLFTAPYFPLVQELPGAKPSRINVLQDLFFLSRENQKITGVGYVVRTNQTGSGFTGIPLAGMGTLYRFESTHSTAFFANDPDVFKREYDLDIRNETNLNKVIEGVVHFTVRTFDPKGRAIDFNHPNLVTNLTDQIVADAFGYGESAWTFFSNAVPATVEIELGILEDAALAKVKAIPDANRRYAYLTNQVSRVHLFRIRVPLRNVDPTAYQ